MHDRGVRTELRRIVGDPIVEAGAHGEDRVGMVHGHVGFERAVHAEHAEKASVGPRKSAETHQRVGDRKIELVDQFSQFLGGVALHDAAAGIDHGALGIQQRSHGFSNLPAVAAQRRVVGAQRNVPRIAVFERRVGVRGVLRNVDDHRTRAARGGDIEGSLHDLRNLRRLADEEAVLHDRAGDADHVGLLKRVGADLVVRHLARNHDDRRRIHVGRRDAGNGVGRARPRRDQDYARPARSAGIPVGHVGRALFVAHQYVLHLLLFENGVVDVQGSPARIPEKVINPFVLQGANQHVGAGQHLRHGTSNEIWIRAADS